MNFFAKSFFILCLIVLITSSCKTGVDTEQTPDRSPLKIILFDSLSVDYDDDSRRLPESMRNLCAAIISEDKDCNRIFILDPSLNRLDLGKSISLKTTIEKGGAKNISNPKVIGKLIQKNFDELEIPKEFTLRGTDRTINDKLNQLAAAESKNDSILIFSESNSAVDYSLNGKSYKVSTSFEEVRNKITAILCQSDKAGFTLLINPPTNTTITATATSSTTIATSTSVVNGPSTTNPRHGLHVRPKVRTAVKADNGDLSMIKDSEGCDVCTRYYSATDKLGRTRHITEKNSTFCCPCGKTIQMNGRTYRMECDGPGNNRLALVQ